MILADKWYASGLWTVAGVIFGLVAAVAATWVLFVPINRRRVLVYGMPQVTRMINAGHQLSQDLKVVRGDALLKEPYVVTLTLVNRSRVDIPSTAFDGEMPLRLDIGTPILEILGTGTLPKDLACPKVATDGSAVLIGPSKIGRGQQVAIALLVDGAEPKAVQHYNTLIDVKLRNEATPAHTPKQLPAWVAAVLGTGATVAAGETVTAAATAGEATALVSGAVAGVGFVVLATLVAAFRAAKRPS